MQVFMCMNAHTSMHVRGRVCGCPRVCVHVTCVHLKPKRPKGDHNRPTKSTSIARTHHIWCAIILPLKAEASRQLGETSSKDSEGQMIANLNKRMKLRLTDTVNLPGTAERCFLPLSV